MALKSTERRIDELELDIASKQDVLISGTNIKTINSNSLLGSGDLVISGGVSSVGLTTGTTGTDINVSGSPITSSGSITLNIPTASATNTGKLSSSDWSTFNGKQAALVSGTNIKTINSTSLLGSGDITISTGITIGTTAISSGTANRILFQNGSNVVSQSANLTFDNASGVLQSGVRVIAGTNGMTNTGGALFVYAGNANDNVQRIFNTAGTAIYNFRTTSNGSMMEFCNSAGTPFVTIKGQWSDALTFGAGRDIYFDTGTGTKIGAATNQKLAFWNKTPIVQPTTAISSATRAGTGGTNITTTTTFDGYTLAQVVLALRNIGLLA